MLPKPVKLLDVLTSPPSPEDISSVLATSGAGIAVTLINAIVYALSGDIQSSFGFMSIWLVSTLTLCSLLYFRSFRASGQVVTRVSRRAARRLNLFAVVLALPWASLAIFQIGYGTEGNHFLAYLVCAGMSAGGTFMLYRTLAASVSYYATILIAVVIASFVRGGFEAIPVLVFSLIYGGSLTYFAFEAGETARQRDASVDALSTAVQDLQNAQEENYRLAFVDTVTGLPNRKAFIASLEEATKKYHDISQPFALLMFDLDRFKNVNDMFGHTVGDELLNLVGERLRSVVRPSEFVARLGGDEFAVILPNVAEVDAIKEFATRLNNKLKEPAMLAGRTIFTAASIGVAKCPEHGTTTGKLMLNADLALNKVKETGRGRCVVFNGWLRDNILQNDWIEMALRQALTEKAVTIAYQPKICLTSGRLVGAEALVRWVHPDSGPISPEVFLNVAAERGLLPTLSRYIANHVQSDILAWRDEGIAYPKIAINIHPIDFRSPEFFKDTIAELGRNGITAKDIQLEITEGCFIGRGTDGTLFLLDELVEKGFELSLDDFGTGHASLSHLKKLPVAEIKIDRSFVMGIADSQKDKSIVAATAEIARGMGIRSVAEGVEDTTQMDILIGLGIDVGQGYLWSKPLAAEDFAAYVQDHHANPPAPLQLPQARGQAG